MGRVLAMGFAFSLLILFVVAICLPEGAWQQWRDKRHTRRIGKRELVMHQAMLESAATNFHLVGKAEMLCKQLLDADPLDVSLSEKYERRVTALLREITKASKGDK